MKDSLIGNKGEFLFVDENVKYTVTGDGPNVTIHCEHPIFRRRFNDDTVTMGLKEFMHISHEGNSDFDFFQKFGASVQEHFLDKGV